MSEKLTVDQKVYFQYGYDWHKGRVVSVEPLVVKRASPLILTPKFIDRRPDQVAAR